jgi:DGQHR domain-containing protein
MTKRTVSYPALQLTQNNHRFYFSTVPVDRLFPSCFVARRDENPEEGFQRSLNESRADDIAKYLASGTGSIPSNIVLSAQEIASFKYNSRTKLISFQENEYAFLVLDGQHRLWGYQKCRVRHRVPVAIYNGLTRAEEARLFVDINTTQRGVPAALLLDIKQIAEQENEIESRLREIFDKLNVDSKSPVIGKLSPSKSVTGKISRVAFNRALETALTSASIQELDSVHQYRAIRQYLNAFDAELNDKNLITRAAFFEAIFRVFDIVIQESINKHSNIKQRSLQEIIRPVAKLNYKGSGGKTILDKKSIENLMLSTLRTKAIINKEML